MNAGVYAVVQLEGSVFLLEVLVSAQEYQHAINQTAMAPTAQVTHPRQMVIRL
jgi:hypothetical protein